MKPSTMLIIAANLNAAFPGLKEAGAEIKKCDEDNRRFHRSHSQTLSNDERGWRSTATRGSTVFPRCVEQLAAFKHHALVLQEAVDSGKIDPEEEITYKSSHEPRFARGALAKAVSEELFVELRIMYEGEIQPEPPKIYLSTNKEESYIGAVQTPFASIFNK